MTKRYKGLSTLFYILAMLCFIVPLAVFGVIAYNSYAEHKSLLICGVLALVLFLIDLFRHGKYRMATWVLLSGLVTCASIEMVQIAILVTTCGVFLDDIVFSPLHRHYKQLYTINREIDKRG